MATPSWMVWSNSLFLGQEALEFLQVFPGLVQGLFEAGRCREAGREGSVKVPGRTSVRGQF